MNTMILPSDIIHEILSYLVYPESLMRDVRVAARKRLLSKLGVKKIKVVFIESRDIYAFLKELGKWLMHKDTRKLYKLRAYIYLTYEDI